MESRRLFSIASGLESLVNTTTLLSQTTSASECVAADANGDYVVVWNGSSLLSGNVEGIFAQRFDAAGNPLGAEFVVNQTILLPQTDPAVAMDANGDFVVTWTNTNPILPAIMGRLYDSNGVAKGGEFTVNSNPVFTRSLSTVAMDDAGDFVVAWQTLSQDSLLTQGIFAQRYNSFGVAQGAAFQVNTTTAGDQANAALAMDRSGDFIVTWDGRGTGDTNGIFGQRYNSAGAAQGGEFRINTTTAGIQMDSSVAIDDLGNFVVVWSGQGGPDTTGIYLQQYNAAGVVQGAETLVNTTTAGTQSSASVVSNGKGAFAVVWSGQGVGDATGIFLSQYSAAGVNFVGETLVNTTTTNAQSMPSIARDDGNRLVVAWSGNGTGDADGVFAQRFVNDPPVIDLNGLASGTEFSANFTEDGAAVVLADVTAFLSDSDNSDLESLTVTITNLLDGASEVLSATTTGTNIIASYDANSGILSLSGDDTVAHYQQVMRTIEYQNTSQGPHTVSRVITFVANDGVDDSAIATAILSITASNDAPSISDASFNLAENSGNGTSVGSVSSSDPDLGETLAYSLTAGNTGGAFGVNPATGEITVVNSSILDFETTPTFSLTVRVTDLGGLFDDATVIVNLTNVNEAPSIVNSSFNLAENSTNGAAVGNATGSDPDVTDIISYALIAGNTSGAFAIDSLTGEITVANSAAIDFETHPTFVLDVRATDSGGLAGDGTITINLSDVNEAPRADGRSFSIAENSANATIVGSVPTTDPDAGDTITYSILNGNSGGAFAIDSFSGQITVLAQTALDFESTPSFTLSIEATDSGGLTGTAPIIINLSNVNEPPSANDATFLIAENSSDGSLVGTFAATDPDSGDILSYSLIGGNTGGTFAIDPSTGQIRVANDALLDFETSPLYTLTIRTDDLGGLFDDATMTISLIDVNEPPSMPNQSFSIAENSANGVPVGMLVASDPDVGDLKSFSIVGGDPSGAFAINAANGQITVANSAALNFEAISTFALSVRVTDSGNLFSAATITLNVLDVNEPPSADDQSFSIADDVPDGTVVGTISGNDADAGDILTYSITGGNSNGIFAIEGSTGQIVVSNAAGLVGQRAFALSVRVQDTGNLFDIALANVNVMPVNRPPLIQSQSFTIPENSSKLTPVGTLTATDPNPGDQLFYSIANSAGLPFVIDAGSGKITVSDSSSLDFESNPQFTFVVQVMDAGGLGNTATIAIRLVDVNEAPAVSNLAFSVLEKSANGTVVGTVAASDPDADDKLTFSLVAGNVSGAFAVDADTGQIVVANPAALNAVSNPNFALTVRVRDKGGLTSDATVSIKVTALPPTPQPPPDPTPNPPTPDPLPPDPPKPNPRPDPLPNPEPPIPPAPNPLPPTPQPPTPQPQPPEPQPPIPPQPAPLPVPEATHALNSYLSGLFSWTGGASSRSNGGLVTHFLPDSELPDSSSAISHFELASAVSITAGFVAHFLIAGPILAGLLTSFPTWRWFDPIPVLGSWEKDPRKNRTGRHAEVDSEEINIRGLLT